MLHIPGHFTPAVLRANQGLDHRSTPEDFNAGLRLGPMESVVSLRTEAVSANAVCQHPNRAVGWSQRREDGGVHMCTCSLIHPHLHTHTHTHSTHVHSYRHICTLVQNLQFMHSPTLVYTYAHLRVHLSADTQTLRSHHTPQTWAVSTCSSTSPHSPSGPIMLPSWPFLVL